MLFTKFQLDNGLTVIHHPDSNTRLCVLNILYKVGSRNESPQKTGFAHLFEHLMFGGSVNVPDYDSQLQLAGGENNAFTSTDLTNYYLTLPYHNIETGFWLASDRMLSLDFNAHTLEIQRNVVIEEFKERYLNQPYGDAWAKMLSMAYTKHPYAWPTIGKEISHIEQATLEDVKSFFSSHYGPNNAIMVVAGNISLEETKGFCEKWFGDIPSREIVTPSWPEEPVQTSARVTEINCDETLNMIMKSWHMPGRMQGGYYEADLFSDILGSGKSSRLFRELIMEKKLFSELDCYISGDVDPGLLVVEGKLIKGISPKTANEAVADCIDRACKDISNNELEKVKNRTETTIRFNAVNVLNRAMKLAYCEMLGDIQIAVDESAYYEKVGLDSLKNLASVMMKESNCSTLFYLAKQ